jgi:hypothetical protein
VPVAGPAWCLRRGAGLVARAWPDVRGARVRIVVTRRRPRAVGACNKAFRWSATRGRDCVRDGVRLLVTSAVRILWRDPPPEFADQ